MAVNDALFMSRLNVFDVDVDPLLIPMKTDELTQLEEFLNAPTSLSSSASSLELSLAASSVMPSPYEPSMGRYGSSSSAPDDSTMASLATSPDVHLSLLHHSPAHMESVVAAFLKDQRVVSALQTQNEATYGSSSTSPCGSEPSDFISRLLDPLGSCVSTDDVDTPTSTTKRYPVELPPTQDEDDDLDDDFVSKLKGTRGKKRAKLMETLSDEDRLREQKAQAERSRKSARECRRRKKAYIMSLEKQVAALKDCVARLQQENDTLSHENRVLKSKNRAM